MHIHYLVNTAFGMCSGRLQGQQGSASELERCICCHEAAGSSCMSADWHLSVVTLLTQSNAVDEQVVEVLQFEIPSYIDCGTVWRHAICMRDAQRQAVTSSADG
jgi:hypothetical protein